MMVKVADYIPALAEVNPNQFAMSITLFDGSSYHIGLPGKSGVGGGIVAIVPNVMSVAVFSPRLNNWGNSLAGTKALEMLTTKTRLSIF